MFHRNPYRPLLNIARTTDKTTTLHKSMTFHRNLHREFQCPVGVFEDVERDRFSDALGLMARQNNYFINERPFGLFRMFLDIDAEFDGDALPRDKFDDRVRLVIAATQTELHRQGNNERNEL